VTDTTVIDTPEARALKLFNAMVSDPKTRSAVRAKTKELFPDSTFAEDHMDPVLAPLQDQMSKLQADNEALLKRITDDEAARSEERQRTTLETQLFAARDKFYLTADGFDKMVDRMKETGNYSDPEAAAAWVAQTTPKPKAPGPSWAPSKINFLGDAGKEALEFLHNDPEGYQDAQLAEFAEDPDKYVRETFGV
jgi:hypothetical protein